MIDREFEPVAKRNEEQQAVRRDKDAWKRRLNEDAKYLKESGVLRVFQNRADILRGMTLDAP